MTSPPTTGDNRYPKTRQQTLHLLDKYSKTTTPKTAQSEGTSFSQMTDKGKSYKSSNGNHTSGKKESVDKSYWTDKNVTYAIRKGIQHHIARKEMTTTTTCHALAKQRVSRS
jgi:hypothetical protein